MLLKKIDLKKEFPALSDEELTELEKKYDNYIDAVLIKILSGISIIVAVSQMIFLLYLDKILLINYTQLLKSPRLILIMISLLFLVFNKIYSTNVRGIYQSVIYQIVAIFSVTIILCITKNHPRIVVSWMIIMILTIGILPIPLDKSLILFLSLFPKYIVIFLYYNGFENLKHSYGFLINIFVFGAPALLFKYYFFRPMKKQFYSRLIMQRSSKICSINPDIIKESFSSFIQRYNITKNQAMIIRVIFEGEVTHQGIAEKLNKSRSNISSTLNRIYTKIGVSNQSELMLNIEHIYFD